MNPPALNPAYHTTPHNGFTYWYEPDLEAYEPGVDPRPWRADRDDGHSFYLPGDLLPAGLEPVAGTPTEPTHAPT